MSNTGIDSLPPEVIQAILQGRITPDQLLQAQQQDSSGPDMSLYDNRLQQLQQDPYGPQVMDTAGNLADQLGYSHVKATSRPSQLRTLVSGVQNEYQQQQGDIYGVQQDMLDAQSQQKKDALNAQDAEAKYGNGPHDAARMLQLDPEAYGAVYKAWDSGDTAQHEALFDSVSEGLGLWDPKLKDKAGVQTGGPTWRSDPVAQARVGNAIKYILDHRTQTRSQDLSSQLPEQWRAKEAYLSQKQGSPVYVSKMGRVFDDPQKALTDQGGPKPWENNWGEGGGGSTSFSPPPGPTGKASGDYQKAYVNSQAGSSSGDRWLQKKFGGTGKAIVNQGKGFWNEIKQSAGF